MPPYDAVDDHYCYPGTKVLKNLRNLKSQAALTRFETAITAQRFDEPMPTGLLSVRHYRAVHHHLFQDVYAWAGKNRTLRMSREGNAFCYPEYIDGQLKQTFAKLRRDQYLRDLSADDFAIQAAEFLSMLNAIHVFRDGNGRAQLAFMALIGAKAGHPLHLERLNPANFLRAMIRSFHGDNGQLIRELRRLID
ncbi:adenosine monophosphate-protein transferase [Bradyrhizobium sp. SK17]|uniref:Fic/DOC family protein n=1 Tax=Bradyrhizobium sp. SK17 TaxID=2057741 RepID=UPI000C3161DC|nr:Fic family protein [Bradyrhizobium sp. SK17]AUC97993.1 adenosine monophosphate-protein transferase [Bradyrhizobium sp. SK17]